MNIINLIPTGSNNAIPLNRLCEITGCSGRVIREAISVARREKCILNLQDGRGYFIPADDEKALVERYIKQETARLKSIGWSLKSARERVKNG